VTCRPARPCCSARALVVEPERLPAQRVWRWRFSGSDRSTGRVGHEKAGWHEWWIVRQGQGRGMGMGFVLRRCETRRRPAGRPPTNGPWSVVSYFGDEEGDGMGEVEKKCVAGWPLRAGRSGSVTHPPRPRPARSITFSFPSTPGLRLCPTLHHYCSLQWAAKFFGFLEL